MFASAFGFGKQLIYETLKNHVFCDNIEHEQTIICRLLFAGYVVSFLANERE